MNDLKKKYNEILANYKKGLEILQQDPENQNTLKKLEELQLKMNEILMRIDNYTVQDTENGFDLIAIENVTDSNTQQQIDENKKEKSIIVQQQSESNAVINTMEAYRNNWEMAVHLSKSDLVPDNYKNKPENVIIALGMSQQTGLPPFTIMQNLNIVRGKASFSGSFCKVLIERTGKYKGLSLNYFGQKGEDSYGCYLSAVDITTGEIIKGPEVTMSMAKSEGWTSNKKWLTLTDLMLAYRCQSFFARVYCPEALNGVYTDDEMAEMQNTPREVQDVL